MSRFFSSPYKNAIATPAKREGRYSELPVASSVANETSDGIQAIGDYWLTPGSASGSLLAVPHSTPPGKFASRAPSISTGVRTITSFTADAFDELLYVGGEGGAVKVFDLPPVDEFSTETPCATTPAPLVSLSTSSGKPVDILSAHPLAAGLVLASSGSNITVFDATNGGAVVKAWELPSPAWSVQWSRDGKLVTTTSKDGKLRVWDVRSGGAAVAESLAHAGIKASRHVHLSPSSSGSSQIFTTGFSRTRDREISLFDLRALGSQLKTQRLDTNTGVLQPVLDESRNIVYLAGRGDMRLGWVEVGGPSVFTEGAAALPAPILSAALLPPTAQQSNLDLQHAEINRLLVLSPSEGGVVPVEIKVPRRSYVDFFPELYPPVSAGQPALSAADWLAGKDDGALLETRHLEPGRAWPKKVKKALATSGSASVAAQPVSAPAVEVKVEQEVLPAQVIVVESAPPPPSAARQPSPSPAAASSSSTPPAQSAVPAALAKEEPPTAALSSISLNKQQQRPTFGGGSKATPSSAPSPPPPVVSTPSPPTPATATPPALPRSTPAQSRPTPATKATPPSNTKASAVKPASQPGEPYNPGWSRKFLAGKTPMKPDYFDVKDLSATISADVQLLKATSLYFLYPLSGPGGRLAVHPLSQKGRLPTHVPALQIGTNLVDFATDPFDPLRVFVAGDDGAVRVFELPSEEELKVEGWEKKVDEAQAKVLSAPNVDRINVLVPHPTARNVLLSCSDDRGNPTARVWDVEKGEVIVETALPKGGVSSVAWSPDGALLAVATKNKQIHVLDPRNPSSLASTPSHDSVRPVRLVWASDSHLVSTGFNRCASRELILTFVDRTATTTKVSQVGKQSLDVSPAPLFPYVDIDTRLLFLYSRGERSCPLYEIDLKPNSKQPFDKLSSSFEHGTPQSGFAFFSKTSVDVKAVEVVKALRLTPHEVQVISFTVPRAKVEFFQNDIFIPTRNTEKSTLSASEYAAGKDAPLQNVDLRPAGMQLLSEAPIVEKKVSTRSQIKQDGLTDSQREKAYLDGLFNAAKDEGAEEEEEHPVRNVHTIVDDDDW